MARIEDILQYWLGDLDQDGLAAPERQKMWFQKSEATDRDIRTRFEPDYEAIVGGEREDWLETPRGTLAYVIVLDQLARNMFRETAKMYAADDLALSAVGRALERGWDEELLAQERTFLYMPLMHSESLPDQERCCTCFGRLAEEGSENARRRARGNLDYARRHRDIVAQFGRFPHRNEILGRETTAEEAQFLTQPGSSF